MVEALSSLRDSDGHVRIPGFYEDVRPPTDAQRAALADRTDTEEMVRRMYGIDAFLGGRTGLDLRVHQSFSPTCNIAGLSSGYTEEGVKTVLPARAMAKIDFRLVPDQDPHDIAAKLRAHLDAEGFGDVEITVHSAAEPVVTPMEDPFIQRTIAITEAFAGKPPSVTPLGGGTLPLLGDLRRYVGVPGLFAPGGPGYWGSGGHAPNEHIRLSDLARAVRFNCYLYEGLAE
jgi:acetylornithine deacetylase/succinyl-diaminopimelate desuccinylase-like protein